MGSDTESEDTSDTSWVPFTSRDAYCDVTPLPQDEPHDSPVPIAYSPRFTATMDTFRALLSSNEISERALHVTGSAIRQNAANYTAWHYRRRILDALDGLENNGNDNERNENGGCKSERSESEKNRWRKEFAFIEKIACDSPKNYQLWFHRRAAVERVPGSALGELPFTAAILSEDSKNYHAWAHRQWVVETYLINNNNDNIGNSIGDANVDGSYGIDDEVEFTSGLIESDIRNNSAWNHRHFVLKKSGAFTDLAHVASEISWAIGKCATVPGNEASWNFVTGVAKEAILSRLNTNGKNESNSVNDSNDNDMNDNDDRPQTVDELIAFVTKKCEEIRADAKTFQCESKAAMCEVDIAIAAGRAKEPKVAAIVNDMFEKAVKVCDKGLWKSYMLFF